MNNPDPTTLLIAHLMDEAVRIYSATQFTIFANPHRGNTGIRFQVPEGANARRPEPPESIRPELWEHAYAQVLSDNFDNLYMDWKWPASPTHSPAALQSFANERMRQTGHRIQVK